MHSRASVGSGRAFFLVFVVFVSFVGSSVVPAQSPTNELDADDVVKIALANNQELEAMNKERDAARAMIIQAKLRANPSLETKRAQDIRGMDSETMAEIMVPLELGGRRAARVRVAEAELAVREAAVADAERKLAAEVRMKYGETVTATLKLEIADRMIANAKEAYDLVAARVTEGKTAPLEQNMLLVELNRLRSIRETAAANAETSMLELRNLLGMKSDEPLRLKNDFGDLLKALPSTNDAVSLALASRPDLLGARALETLATAKIENAKAMSRPDADLTGGYQRMRSGFPLNGLDDIGLPSPIENTTHLFTFGIRIELPVRNRNQGEIAAAVFERQAAQSRIAFGEITIRREIAAALVRYEHSVRAQSIFENGVRDQADANLRVVWQTYEFGKTALSEYLRQQREYFEIENEYLDARQATFNSRTEFLRAANAPELIKK